MELTFRQGEKGDIPGVGEVYRTALEKVAGDHGFAGTLRSTSRLNPFYQFCLKNDPEGFWVALDGDGGVAGAAMSWVRGTHWFLSHLFIRPGHQGRGIGRSLLEKTLRYSVSQKCSAKSVITSAFNPVSIALYAKSGMYPQQPVYSFGGTPAKAFLKAAANRVVSEGIVTGEEHIDALASIDQKLLGLPRREHHEYLLLDQKTPCHVFSRGGRICGYAYIDREGHIGPMATASQDLFEDMLMRTILLAHEGSREVSMMVPGPGKTAMRVALDAGLQIQYPSVLMSSQPFGDWSTYLYHSPALM
jgi:ribosomal protein S18 acetylase RimI-like enzyme